MIQDLTNIISERERVLAEGRYWRPSINGCSKIGDVLVCANGLIEKQRTLIDRMRRKKKLKKKKLKSTRKRLKLELFPPSGTSTAEVASDAEDEYSLAEVVDGLPPLNLFGAQQDNLDILDLFDEEELLALFGEYIHDRSGCSPPFATSSSSPPPPPPPMLA